MKRTLTAAVVVVSVFSAEPAATQISVRSEPGSSVRTRADLETLLESYEQVLQSPAYSEAVKEATRAQAERVIERLTVGDFRLGDRVVLYVEGEPELPDTIQVQAGQTISLPLFGDISLAGALRSEVQSRITEALREYIRDPIVRAEGLMRMSVQGAVASPGFYLVPADILVGQTLMVAGGPSPNSRLDELRIERGPDIVLEGEELQEAVRLGLTLDQLNLQAGDQLFVPERAPGGFLGNVALVAGLVGSLSLLVFQLTN